MARQRDSAGKFVSSKRHAVGEWEEDASVLNDFGISGLKRSAGRVIEEFHPKLKGKKGDKVYAEMADNNPIVAAGLWLLEVLVRQAGWKFEAPEDTGEAGQAMAEHYDGQLADMESTWSQTLSRIMSMPQFGWAWHEILFKIRRGQNDSRILNSEHNDGLWGWRDIALRSQDSRERFEWDDDGYLVGMWQRVENEGRLRFIPSAKSANFKIRERKDSPEGRSMLRGVYVSHYYIKRETEIEAVSIERNGAGLAVARIPARCMMSTAKDSEKNIYTKTKDLVKKIRMDQLAGVVFPAGKNPDGTDNGYDISLMSASGRNIAEADPVIKRHRTDLSIGLFVQMLLLGTPDAGGARSISDDQTDIMSMAINSILTNIAETMAGPVRMLHELNAFNPALRPDLTYTDIEKPDIAKLFAALATGVTSGVIVPDNKLEGWARSEAGWPPREDDATQRQIPMAPDPALLDATE